jgi:hypothetical protein
MTIGKVSLEFDCNATWSSTVVFRVFLGSTIIKPCSAGLYVRKNQLDC